jgi:hypothetical protein
MESSTVRKYNFREQSDGAMVGGYSISNILSTNEFSQLEGSARLEGFSVPVGLFTATNTEIRGGDEKIQVKTVVGGTIESELFDKLYGRVIETKKKAQKTVTKKRK